MFEDPRASRSGVRGTEYSLARRPPDNDDFRMNRQTWGEVVFSDTGIHSDGGILGSSKPEEYSRNV
jgi:hypothetical protein